MKHVFWKLSAVFTGLACSLAVSFSSMAAEPSGTLEGADRSSVYGWVWDSDDYNHIIPVEISICPSGSQEVLKTGTIKADHYQDKLQESIGDGYHGFLYPIDWSQFEQTQFRVTAYGVTDTERVFLGELTYNKETDTYTMATEASTDTSGPSSQNAEDIPAPQGLKTSLTGPAGPASPSQESPDSPKEPDSGQADSSENSTTVTEAKQEVPQTQERVLASWEKGPGVTPPKKTSPKGESLGIFVTTGYCNCEICCGGSTLTYSGTVPQSGHTISADINLFPIGTKLMIDDVIYCVEDIGSGVTGNRIDIFYDTHQEAMDHGRQEQEVFTVIEID